MVSFLHQLGMGKEFILSPFSSSPISSSPFSYALAQSSFFFFLQSHRLYDMQGRRVSMSFAALLVMLQATVSSAEGLSLLTTSNTAASTSGTVGVRVLLGLGFGRG